MSSGQTDLLYMSLWGGVGGGGGIYVYPHACGLIAPYVCEKKWQAEVGAERGPIPLPWAHFIQSSAFRARDSVIYTNHSKTHISHT